MKSCDTAMKLHRSFYKVGYMPATKTLDNIFEKLLLLKTRISMKSHLHSFISIILFAENTISTYKVFTK